MQPPPSSVPVSAANEPPPPSAYPRSGGRAFPSSRLITVLGVLIGLFVFVGFLSFHAAFLIPVPCTSAYGCPTPTQTPDVIAYVTLVRGLAWVSAIVLDLAVGLAVALAFIMGARADLPESTRRGAFIFATVLVGVWTVFGYVLFTYLASLVRYL